MDIKGLALFILALAALSGAVGATVCKRRGIGGAKAMLKIALSIFVALFTAVAALLYLLAVSFPQ